MPISITGPVPQVFADDVLSLDGHLRVRSLSGYAGMYITVDFTALLPTSSYNFSNPFKATVYRQNDSGEVEIVRGGDKRTQYGGAFQVFDDEVRFGRIYMYWVEVYDRDENVSTTSDIVQIQSWEPAGGFNLPGVWFKCLDDPAKSMPVRVMSWVGGTYAGNASKTSIINSKYPGVNLRIRSAFTTQMTILTHSDDDNDEYEDFLSLAETGVMHIVGLSRHRRRDGYYVMDDIAPTRVSSLAASPYDAWSLDLSEVARPSTLNQNGAVTPWRNLKDRKAEFPTYKDATDSPSNIFGGTRVYLDGPEPV